MAKSKLKGKRLHEVQQGLCHRMKQMFRTFWNNCYLHEDILQWRQQQVFDTEQFQRLTDYYKAMVHQCFDTCIEALSNKHFWTHVLPGEPHRYLSRTNVDEPTYGPRIREVIEGRGAHAYVLRIFRGNEIAFPRVIIPWTKKEFDEDITAGLLTPAVLKIIRNPYHDGSKYIVRRYYPAYTPNGRIGLAYEAVDNLAAVSDQAVLAYAATLDESSVENHWNQLEFGRCKKVAEMARVVLGK